MEQDDSYLFNRAKLINIGAKFAVLNHQEKCQISSQNLCLIIHDIDMLPVNGSLQYNCEKSPKMMATAAQQFEYKMPYLHYFGGVVATSWAHFKSVNGMSNKYVSCIIFFQSYFVTFFSVIGVGVVKMTTFITDFDPENSPFLMLIQVLVDSR